MEKHQYALVVLIVCVIASLGVASFISCIAAEIHRTTGDELKLVGILCKLPESRAVGFGIAALVCLIIAQMIGNLILICSYIFSRGKKSNSSKARQPTVLRTLPFISWISFIMAVLVISTAISMSRKQSYGEGWLNGECYLVKPGIYTGSGILVLITVGSTLWLIITTVRKKTQDDEGGFKVGDQQSKLDIKL